MKKLAFLEQNYGLTPFGKIRFLRCQKLFVFILKKSFFSIGNIIEPYF